MIGHLNLANVAMSSKINLIFYITLEHISGRINTNALASINAVYIKTLPVAVSLTGRSALM